MAVATASGQVYNSVFSGLPGVVLPTRGAVSGAGNMPATRDEGRVER